MSDEFRDYLQALLSDLDVKHVSTDDAATIHRALVKKIRDLESARGGLKHEWITVKPKGRVVIPKNLRDAAGLEEGTVLDCHLYPNPQRPRGIVMIKER